MRLAAQEGGRPRFSIADLRPQLMPLLTNLFGAFSKPESGENEYLMKAVMRAIVFVGPEVGCLFWPLLPSQNVTPVRTCSVQLPCRTICMQTRRRTKLCQLRVVLGSEGSFLAEAMDQTATRCQIRLNTHACMHARAQIAPVASLCLERLAAMLLEVCRNPTQPGFNHYLFESVAALIRYSAAADAAKVAELEAALFPAFNVVLQQDVQVWAAPFSCLSCLSLVSTRSRSRMHCTTVCPAP
jgi:hypothetical protein